MPNEMKFDVKDPSAMTRGETTTLSADAAGTNLVLRMPTDEWEALLERRLQERLATVGDELRDRFNQFKEQLTDAGGTIESVFGDFASDVQKRLSIKNRRAVTTQADPEPETEEVDEPEQTVSA